MEISRTKQIIFALVTVSVALMLLEGAARLLESQVLTPALADPGRSGWQTEFFGSLFDWHEPDPELLWRFKPGLNNPLITTNSDGILGPEYSRRKPPNTYRVLVLGDSSPVGLGLESRGQTFSELLRRLLDRYFASRKEVEVINAAVSGYSSEQALRFFETRGFEYDPDLVVVYVGNNDASISGARSDRELLAGHKLALLRSFFSRLAIYRVMRGIIRPRRTSSESGPEFSKIRVTPEQFGANLRRLAELGRERNCPVVILKPPVPYLWPAGLQFRPFLHLTGEDGQILIPEDIAVYLGRDIAYCLDEERFRSLIGTGDIFTKLVFRSAFRDTLPPQAAISYYTGRLRSDSDNPIWHNNLGVALWREGRFAQADSVFRQSLRLFRHQHPDALPAIAAASSPFLFNLGINCLSCDSSHIFSLSDTTGDAFIYLDSALQADYFSLRIKRLYWDEIDRLQGFAGATVIDLPRIFRENGGERLFIDHCHPTAEGHMLIAGAIYDIISNRRW